MSRDLLLPTPTGAELRAAREASGHSQAQAAALMGYGRSDRVSEAERGIGAIEPARWSLYLLAVGQHPAYRLVRRSAQISALLMRGAVPSNRKGD